MIFTRRELLSAGGGLAAVLSSPPLAARAADAVVEIGMQGRADGSQVWFDPIGILIKPGQTIRWTNLDKGNSHTTTAYGPENFDRPRRIPSRAMTWNSDYLLPNETFLVTFAVDGVYDYYCIPHEHAGMVGRIIVGDPGTHRWTAAPGENSDLPKEALAAFPAVEEIMASGVVHRG
jgi:plastocyanin